MKQKVERYLISDDPYFRPKDVQSVGCFSQGAWPCRWITCPDAGKPPFVTAFRRKFSLKRKATLHVHVTADERYELFLDGQRVGQGSERGDKDNWFYESYRMNLTPGAHVLVARVWSLGPYSPLAQMTVSPGFLFSPEGKQFIQLLGTGVAPWETKKLEGYGFITQDEILGTGADCAIYGNAFPWGFEKGLGSGWKPAQASLAGQNSFVRNNVSPTHHFLRPALLPPMLETIQHLGRVRFCSAVKSIKTDFVPVRQSENNPVQSAAWDRMVQGDGSVKVPPHSRLRVILDLENYYCAYPALVVSRGKASLVRVHWAESLYNILHDESKMNNDVPWWEKQGVFNIPKGNRDEIEGKFFYGVGDVFYPDGGKRRTFTPLWWQAGRYIEFVVETKTESLVIESFSLRETRYPLEMESSFQSSDPRLARVTPLMLRALQMCSHETYMDCPYYEQLMYIGDTRLQALTTYLISPDHRLPKKAIQMFEAGRLSSGITLCSYPNRGTGIIPGFSLWWVAMVYDYALWQDDFKTVKNLLPGTRAVLDCYRGYLNKDGLVQAARGWNFMDWVPEWAPIGMSPDSDLGINGLVNWQFVLVLAQQAQLEEWAGETELASRGRQQARVLADRLKKVFWDPKRGLMSDDVHHKHFSEHTQCLALLSGLLDKETEKKIDQGLLNDKGLCRTTIYFSHYLFEALRILGRIDILLQRMELWFGLQRQGFKTTVETPEPSRSDCHGWGAHPLYHYFATILGIRPGSLGFKTVTIAPQLGSLSWAKGTMAHPKGFIEADLRLENGRLKGRIILPKGLNGTFAYKGRTSKLKPGKNNI